MSTTIARVEVVPVAGHDSALLNLSGCHGPYFTRNIAIVTDSTASLDPADAAREDIAVIPLKVIIGAQEHVEGQDVTADMIAECSCEAGCPACVVSPKCGNGNEPLSKSQAAALLELLHE